MGNTLLLPFVGGALAVTGSPPAAPTLDTTAISSSRIDGNYVADGSTGRTDTLEYTAGAGAPVTATVTGGAFSLTSLAAATAYAFRIRSSNFWGNSEWSAAVTVETPPAGPPPVAPSADFAADTTTPAADQSVTITDLSTGNPTSWSGTWGDGATFSGPGPWTHLYTTRGPHTVSLTASNAVGPNTKTRTAYITVPVWSSTPFSGSQALTTSHVQAASATLDPASYPVSAGQSRQYRWSFDFSGTVGGFDQLEGTEYRTAGGYIQSAGIVQNAGWLDESGAGWWLNPSAAGWSHAAGQVTLDGTVRLQGPMIAPGPFTLEFTVGFTRTGQYEAGGSTWTGAQGRVLVGRNAAGKPQLNIVTPAGAGVQVVAANAIATGTYKFAVVTDDATFTHLFVDGVRVCTTPNSPKHNADKRGFSLSLGGDGDNANRLVGTIGPVRWSRVARYTGASYTPPATLTADADTACLWTFASAPAALSVTTAWMPFPAASTAVSVRCRNKAAARGTLTAARLEVAGLSGDVEFTLASTTPIVAYGTAPYRSSDCAAPDFNLDVANGRWVLDYSAYDGSVWTLAQAYAAYDANHADGVQGLKGSWTDEAGNPVMVPNSATEGYICCNNTVIIRADGWHSLYNGNVDAIPGRTNTFHALSTDYGLTWTRQNGGAAVLELADTGPDQVADPQGYLDAADHFTLWTQSSNSLTTRELWRNKSADGNSWDRQRVFGPPPMSTTNIGEPSVIETDPGVWHFLQDTSDGIPNGGRRLLRGYSNDFGRTASYRRNVVTEVAGSPDQSGQVFDGAWKRVGASKVVLIRAGSVGLQSNQGMHSNLWVMTADWRPGQI